MATIHPQSHSDPNGIHNNTTATTNSPPPTYQLSIPMPAAPPTSAIRIRLTLLSSTTLLLFLTSTTGDSASAAGTTLGSFVYAMPDRLNPLNPALSTPLYTLPASHDFSTRMAKILARKTGRACYVSSSVSFTPGATVEEEMKAFRDVVGVVVDVCAGARLEA